MQIVREIFCFSVDQLKFAIQLNQIDRVIQSVAIQKVPDSSPLLYGLVDYHGQILPVIDVRYRLGLCEKTLSVDDFFILITTIKRIFIIIATEIHGMIEVPEQEILSIADLVSGIGMTGVLRRADGIYFIYDFETFVTREEDIILEEVIKTNQETEP